jgi:hypothetical protein
MLCRISHYGRTKIENKTNNVFSNQHLDLSLELVQYEI